MASTIETLLAQLVSNSQEQKSRDVKSAATLDKMLDAFKTVQQGFQQGLKLDLASLAKIGTASAVGQTISNKGQLNNQPNKVAATFPQIMKHIGMNSGELTDRLNDLLSKLPAREKAKKGSSLHQWKESFKGKLKDTARPSDTPEGSQNDSSPKTETLGVLAKWGGRAGVAAAAVVGTVSNIVAPGTASAGQGNLQFFNQKLSEGLDQLSPLNMAKNYWIGQLTPGSGGALDLVSGFGGAGSVAKWAAELSLGPKPQ